MAWMKLLFPWSNPSKPVAQVNDNFIGVTGSQSNRTHWIAANHITRVYEDGTGESVIVTSTVTLSSFKESVSSILDAVNEALDGGE